MVRAGSAFEAVPLFVAAAVAPTIKVAGHIRRLSSAVPVDAAQLVAGRIRRLVIAFGAAVAASRFVVAVGADLALVAVPLVRAVAVAADAAVARNVVGVVRAVGLDSALEFAAIRVGVKDVDTLSTVRLGRTVVRPRTSRTVRSIPEVAAVADAAVFLVASNCVRVAVAVRVVVAGERAAWVVDAASGALTAVTILVVDLIALRAVGAVPLVRAVAVATSSAIARDVVGVATAIEGVVAKRRAVGIAAVAFGAGSAVLLGVVADRADAAVSAVPLVLADAHAVRIESRHRLGVRRAVGRVRALEAAVRVITGVATSSVADSAVFA